VRPVISAEDAVIWDGDDDGPDSLSPSREKIDDVYTQQMTSYIQH